MTFINWNEAEDVVAQIERDRRAVVFDVDGITLQWIRGGYFIGWGDLRKAEHLLRWCHHLIGKPWFTPIRMRLFIEEVSKRKGWRILGIKRKNDRHKLTPALRMSILTRDGFRCVLCYRSPTEDQVKLHVDHIVPIAGGGETTRANLRTLCAGCNIGKGAT